MTTFPPNHINVLKQQAFKLRDTLITAEVVEEVPKKAKWLSIFARGIGDFKDWGTLQHLAKGFSENSPSAVLVGDVAERLTYTLKKEIGDSTVDLSDIYNSILSVCTDEEKLLNGVALSHSILAPTVFTLEITPSFNYELPFLLWLWKLKYERSFDTMVAEYAEVMKRHRKSCKSELEIKSNHYDVFPKKGDNSVISIIRKLTKTWHLVSTFRNGTEYIDLSANGKAYVERYLTNNFDEKWQSWWSQFNKLTSRLQFYRLEDDWSVYIKKYADGLSPEIASSQCDYHEDFKRIGDSIVETIHRDFDLQDTHQVNHPRFIYVSPRMVLEPQQYNLPAADFEFSVEGPEWMQINSDFKLSKLWPNKRFIGVKTESHCGWFAKIPDGLTDFTVNFNWSSRSGAFPPAKHEITYYLANNKEHPNCWLFNACITEEANFSPMNTFEDCPVTVKSLTHGKNLSIEQIKELDRVKAGMTYIEYTKEAALIKEERHLLATNQYELAKFLEI